MKSTLSSSTVWYLTGVEEDDLHNLHLANLAQAPQVLVFFRSCAGENDILTSRSVVLVSLT